MSSLLATAATIGSTLDTEASDGAIVIEGVRAISTDVGLAAPFKTLTVFDFSPINSSTKTVTLTTSTNPLVIGSGTQGSVLASPDGMTLTLAGTLDQINADLKLLSYLSTFAGSDTVTLNVTDSAGSSDSASFAVNVLSTPSDSGGPTVASYVKPTSVGQNATLSGGNQVYTADNKIDVVTATNTATTVTGGATGSNLTLVQTGGSYDFTNESGSALVVANAAAGAIKGGATGSKLVAFLQNEPATYTGGSGNDELIGGSGAMTVHGGSSGSLTVFGGTGTLNFQGGSGHEILVGGAGAETIQAAVSGGDYFGGTGGSQMFATGAGTFLIGAVNGDMLTASSTGGDGLIAGAGNETLNGGGSRGENVLFGGTGIDAVTLGAGNDTFVGGTGADVIQMGSGSASLFTGSGHELFSFDAAHTTGASPGSDTIVGFRVGVDYMNLTGGLAVSQSSSSGTMTSLQLNDGTQIHLAGVADVPVTSLFV